MFKHQRGALKHFKNQAIQINEGFEFTDCNSEVIIRILSKTLLCTRMILLYSEVSCIPFEQ